MVAQFHDPNCAPLACSIAVRDSVLAKYNVNLSQELLAEKLTSLAQAKTGCWEAGAVTLPELVQWWNSQTEQYKVVNRVQLESALTYVLILHCIEIDFHLAHFLMKRKELGFAVVVVQHGAPVGHAYAAVHARTDSWGNATLQCVDGHEPGEVEVGGEAAQCTTYYATFGIIPKSIRRAAGQRSESTQQFLRCYVNTKAQLRFHFVAAASSASAHEENEASGEEDEGSMAVRSQLMALLDAEDSAVLAAERDTALQPCHLARQPSQLVEERWRKLCGSVRKKSFRWARLTYKLRRRPVVWGKWEELCKNRLGMSALEELFGGVGGACSSQ